MCVCLLIAAGIITIAGGSMFLTGYSRELQEERFIETSSAIRAVANITLYSAGIIVACLGIILGAITGLLLKR